MQSPSTQPATQPATRPALALLKVLAGMPSDLKYVRGESSLRRMHRESWVLTEIRGQTIAVPSVKVTEIAEGFITVEVSPQVLVTMPEEGTTMARKIKRGDRVAVEGTVQIVTSKVNGDAAPVLIRLIHATIK